MTKLNEVLLTIAVNCQFKPFGQGVDHRYTYTMQTARYFIGIAVELSTRMQDSHDDFGSRSAFFLVYIGGNTASVIADADRVVSMNNYIDFIAMAR